MMNMENMTIKEFVNGVKQFVTDKETVANFTVKTKDGYIIEITVQIDDGLYDAERAAEAQGMIDFDEDHNDD